MNPVVSVIIPTFNAEKCIAEALDSVFAQTYRHIENILSLEVDLNIYFW
jgi:glycosyltransferase involved in cell wall biosynthesis